MHLQDEKTVTVKTLQKHAYSIYIENFTSKNGKFADKISDIFYISAQSIDCGYSL